jgi:hypothetical protein
MRLIKTLLMLLAGCFLFACNLLMPQSQPPQGIFYCMGIHNGMWAGVGEITFNADGTLTFGSSEGTWAYNANTHELTIEGNEYFANGVYYAEENLLALTLKPGEELSHAETGELNCQPMEE